MMHKSTRRMTAAVHAEFDRVRKQIEPQLAASPQPEMAVPEIRNMQAAQNVLRSCMEATLEKLAPFSMLTPVEMAIRLASYALSAAEMERQDEAMAAFMSTFLLAHEKRMHNGIRINTVWRAEDGRERPNFPEPRP